MPVQPYGGEQFEAFGTSNRAVTYKIHIHFIQVTVLAAAHKFVTVQAWTIHTRYEHYLCICDFHVEQPLVSPNPRSHLKLQTYHGSKAAKSMFSLPRFTMLPRRSLQTDPIHPQPQTQDANIDSWTRIQELFNMPIETFLRELKPNRGWLVFPLLPLASIAKILNWHPTIALAVNITAIILLSEMISISSNELATYLGELQGALLSATFGNTVELTVSFKG